MPDDYLHDFSCLHLKISVPASKVIQGGESTTECITVTQGLYCGRRRGLLATSSWTKCRYEGLAVLLPSVCLVGNVGLFGIPYSAAISSASLLYMKQDPAAQSEKRGPSKSRAEISTSSKRQRSSGVGSNFAANQLVSIFFFFGLTGVTWFQVWGAPLRPKVAANLDPSDPFIVDTYLTLPYHVRSTPYLLRNQYPGSRSVVILSDNQNPSG